MTDRDRQINVLAELLENLDDLPFYTYKDEAEYLIDEYGVIVPPCKVGDKVYIVGVFTGQVIPTVVIGIDYTANDMFLHLDNSNFVSVVHQLGKTVFLTKEEAEAELQKRGKENEC